VDRRIDPDEAPGDGSAGDEPSGPAGPSGDGSAGSRLARLRTWRPGIPRSRGGMFALLLLLGGLGSVFMFTGVSVLHWTETADFCGRCHSMEPELAAYEAGAHREVSCAECHVEPGVAGWIKAKMNGTRQLVEVVLGTYPEPIPPPDHAELPPASVTCQKCHTVERFALAKLQTVTQYTEDEKNTRQFVGLMIRPRGGDVFDVDRSVHWHVIRDVVYRTSDSNAATIDYVAVIASDGTVREFISQDQIRIREDVRPDIERILARDHERTMTCYDCHNRVGHPIPNPRKAMDQAMSSGRVDPSLPYIKREAMRILWSGYSTFEAADRAADQLRTYYELRYPLMARTKSAAIDAAIEEIKVLYRLTATPEMKVTAATYPDNLGHRDFPGCFRCHDGGHFLVEDGVATEKAIPATCDACHTFPQLGEAVASLPLGIPPETHNDGLFVFNHRLAVDSVDPGRTSCGECHARDYCANCHDTGAVGVGHDEMLIEHAAVIRDTGAQACAYCHQPVYCARCHNEPVLPAMGVPQAVRDDDRVGYSGPSPEALAELAWPLRPPGH
jgi:nitrate/TMAO reductase-like tetraheme cytochrome c subunit